MMEISDTIAAIATPVGNSGIGIIRISGDGALNIADEIIRSRSGKSLDLFSSQSHRIHYGYVTDGKRIIDEILVSVFRKPRTYTSEDTVEINCHGGMFVLNEVLSLVIAHGARLAREGEFTERAFLNGRIDLTQAEAIMDLISSENEFSRNNSLSQIKGSEKEKISELRDRIIHEAAFIESALDDPEHYDIDDDYKDRLLTIIDNISEEIRSLLNDADRISFLKNGVKTVIIGRPNVGKSSLMNMFAGYEKAIVTSVPGTTRDIVEEKISIEGLILNLTDTAGIHDTADEVESIGIQRAKDSIKEADLILFMIDSSDDLNIEDRYILKEIQDKKSIVILNKTDLSCRTNKDLISDMTDSPVVEVSVKDKTGIQDLKNIIKEMFYKNEIEDGKKIYITNKRHIELLKNVLTSLEETVTSIRSGMTEDTYTIDLMDAYINLGYIIGEEISDDLADRIFSEFCMGK